MALSKDPVVRAKQLANLEKGKFKPGQVPNPKGRPRTTIGSIIQQFEAEGMAMPSPSEISKIYFYTAARTEDELKDMVKDKSLPMMTRIIARGVLDKKGLDVLERIVDRAYGKEQRVDITTNGKDLHIEPLQIHFVADKEQLAKIQDEVKPMEDKDDGKE